MDSLNNSWLMIALGAIGGLITEMLKIYNHLTVEKKKFGEYFKNGLGTVLPIVLIQIVLGGGIVALFPQIQNAALAVGAGAGAPELFKKLFTAAKLAVEKVIEKLSPSAIVDSGDIRKDRSESKTKRKKVDMLTFMSY